MKCKICNQNDTDSTSGICDECFFKEMTQPLLDMGEGHSDYPPIDLIHPEEDNN